MSKIMMLLVNNSTGQFAFYSQHRGLLEGNTAYYPARSTAWDTSLSILLTASVATTATISWGDSANTVTSHNIATGSGTICSFTYASAEDTEPINPTDPIANHIAKEKRVQITFASSASITGVKKTDQADATRFGELGLINTSINDFDFSRELLTNLPPFPATLRTLHYGIPKNAATAGNAIPFESMRQATELCAANLRILDSGVMDQTFYGSVYQNVPNTQVFDLSLFPALEEAYIQASGMVKLTIKNTNTVLRILRGAGISSTRPLVDFTECFIPPTLTEFRCGDITALRADNTKDAIPFQTARDLTVAYCGYMFVAGGNGLSVADGRKAFYQTVYNLWVNRANHVAGVKTANFAGNGSVSIATTEFPSGVTQYINDLAAVGWSITYTA